MKNQFFPKEFIGASIEHYSFKVRAASQTIYLILLICIAGIIAALPFIRVDVTRTTSGKVTPTGPRQNIQVPVSGKVVFSSFEENRYLEEGDTLLKLNDERLQKEIKQIDHRQIELKTYTHDLSILSSENVRLTSIMTQRYQLEYEEFRSQYDKLLLIEKNRKKVYKRQKSLFDAKVIAEKEFEIDQLNYDEAVAERLLFVHQKKTQWQQAILAFEKEIDELEIRKNQLTDERNRYVLLAPVSGTLQNVTAVEPGQFLHPGETLAQISPGDSLIVTCYVSPSDIGLLQVGQKGTFRFDAFNFNEWGMLDGEIIEISNDAYILEDARSVFMVKCALHGSYLTLKNGFKGNIRKGMTLQANFLVANRSLYQILYDKVSDWINPQLNQTALNK